MESRDLAAAVASRICHDLVSPVGAIVNGADLMRELGAADMADAMGIVGQSARRASALLQFYRVAFGAGAADARPISREALRELVAVLAHPPRIVLQWSIVGPAMEQSRARLLALLLLCARSVTGMRGVIAVETADGCRFPFVVRAEAESFSVAIEMLDLLTEAPGGQPISPRAVEFVMARELASANGLALRASRSGTCLAISAVPVAAPA